MSDRSQAVRVYLDYAATTPLSPGAARAMDEACRSYPANPNSLHTLGRQAHQKFEESRGEVAALLGAHMPSEVVFTSGGTESDVTALYGIADALAMHRRTIIVSAMEHDALLHPARYLASKGFDIIYAKPDRDGYVTPEILKGIITPDVGLVSIQMANNEIGTIQPVDELAGIAHDNGALFHTDAVQAVGRCRIDVARSGIDALSISGHKFHGPHGMGVLYLRSGIPFRPLMLGGGQESGLRSGTQNVAGAAGLAAALKETLDDAVVENARERILQAQLLERLDALSTIKIVCDPRMAPEAHLPNLVTITALNMESELLVLKLDEAGYEVSGGSACSSGSSEPSHVLTAIGIDEDEAIGELRITFGRETTEDDLMGFMDALAKILS